MKITTRKHSKRTCPRSSICTMITIFLAVMGIVPVIIYTVTQENKKKRKLHRVGCLKQNSICEQLERNNTDETQRTYSSTSSDETTHENLDDEIEGEDEAPETPQNKEEKLSWWASFKLWLSGSAKNKEIPESTTSPQSKIAEEWKTNFDNEQKDASDQTTYRDSENDNADEDQAPETPQNKEEKLSSWASVKSWLSGSAKKTEIPKSTTSSLSKTTDERKASNLDDEQKDDETDDSRNESEDRYNEETARENKNGCTGKAPKNFKRDEKENKGMRFTLHYFLKESTKCPVLEDKEELNFSKYDNDEVILEILKKNNSAFKLVIHRKKKGEFKSESYGKYEEEKKKIKNYYHLEDCGSRKEYGRGEYMLLEKETRDSAPKGYVLVKLKADDHCLFAALATALGHGPQDQDRIRRQIAISGIDRFEDYFGREATAKETNELVEIGEWGSTKWGGEVQINIAAHYFKKKIQVWYSYRTVENNFKSDGIYNRESDDLIMLRYDGTHYDLFVDETDKKKLEELENWFDKDDNGVWRVKKDCTTKK